MGLIPTLPASIPMPFAYQGERSVIPSTSNTAGSAQASWASGFPPITRINKLAGGKPPLGMDFQSLLYAMTNHLFYQQSGCQYSWSNALDYLPNSRVQGSNGKMYSAVAMSGPDTSMGAVNPVSDIAHTCWIADDEKYPPIPIAGPNSTALGTFRHLVQDVTDTSWTYKTPSGGSWAAFYVCYDSDQSNGYLSSWSPFADASVIAGGTWLGTYNFTTHTPALFGWCWRVR